MASVIIIGGQHVNDAVKAMETASLNWNDTSLANGRELLDSVASQLTQFTNSQGIGPHAAKKE